MLGLTPIAPNQKTDTRNPIIAIIDFESQFLQSEQSNFADPRSKHLSSRIWVNFCTKPLRAIRVVPQSKNPTSSNPSPPSNPSRPRICKLTGFGGWSSGCFSIFYVFLGLVLRVLFLGTPLTICRGFSAIRAQNPENAWKKSPVAVGPQESLENVPKKSFRDLFETFSRLSGGPWAGGLLQTLRLFFGVSAPEGPRDPCKWSRGSR